MATNSEALLDLGRRLAQRRSEARLDIVALASRANVEVAAVEAFERGEGGLGLSALTRIARELGVPKTSFIHTNAPQTPAPTEPSILLRQAGSSSLTEADRQAIAHHLRRAAALSDIADVLGHEDLGAGIAARPAPASNAHLDGYQAAHEVRALLGETGPLYRLARLLESRFRVLVVWHRFGGSNIQGASCRWGRARLVVIHRAIVHEAARRFTLAHELCHQLLDLDTDGASFDDRATLGGSFEMERPAHEKRANAFAAMLLAPDAAIQRLLGPPAANVGTLDGKSLVERARRHFGLGYEATTWHLLGRGYLPSEEIARGVVALATKDTVEGFEDPVGGEDALERFVREAIDRHLVSEARARELLGHEVAA